MEFVYVVKRSDLFDIELPQETATGFITRQAESEGVDGYLTRARERGFFIERRFTEQDSSFKQIIPYVVIVRGSEILTLRRKKTQGEARLHNKLSIGIGGHINPGDTHATAAASVIEEGMRRELNEELQLSAPPPVTWMGVLNDDSNAVGAVHFGIVGRADAGSIDVSVREQEMMSGEFIEATTLQDMAGDPEHSFETWSRLLIERIDLFVW